MCGCKYRGNKLLKIGICDDDKIFATELEGFILEFAKRNKLEFEIEIYTKSEELLAAIRKGYTCDLLFLDIELGDATGVEIGEWIRSDIKNEAMQIVFVSAEENYAMQLFNIRPMNFLVKPIDYSKVEYILREYGRLYKFQTCFFEFSVGKDKRKMDQKAIIYLQSQGKKIRIVTQGGETEFYGKLSDILPQLNEYRFCAVHKSYIINMQYVEEYGKESVWMVNKDVIPVSRAMRDNLHKKVLEVDGGAQGQVMKGCYL